MFEHEVMYFDSIPFKELLFVSPIANGEKYLDQYEILSLHEDKSNIPIHSLNLDGIFHTSPAQGIERCLGMKMDVVLLWS